MSNYQSFPGRHGASQSEAKLRSLYLPDLKGKSFLDVGCNEGFFCGFAQHAGASRVVGIDSSTSAIGMARLRFPGVEFVCQSWNTLPSGQFDCILCASALHYADDQPALIHKMVSQLSPGGVLVLEIGVHPDAGNAVVAVRRAIDTREFMTWDRLYEVLSPYVWKGIGASVKQAGDPIDRHVIHVAKRIPTAFLLTTGPNSGKSTVARTLFGSSATPIIQGDLLVQRMATDPELAPEIYAAIEHHFSHRAIDLAIDAICRDPHLLEIYAGHVARVGANADFAYDGYLPAAGRDVLVEQLQASGYLVVKLDFAKAEELFAFRRNHSDVIDAFMAQHALPGLPTPKRWEFCVDSVKRGADGVLIEGWVAPDTSNQQPELKVRYNNNSLGTLRSEQVLRPDVRKHLQIENENLGFRILIEPPPSDPASVDFYVTDAEGQDVLVGAMFI